jgi:hypothetical protein
MKLKLIITLVCLASVPACKQRDEATEVRSSQPAAGSTCQLDDTWAGRMGMRLQDTPQNDGAVIDCVVVGEGLHHIGLAKGDKIVALNFGTKVTSASGFEKAASALVASRKKRIRRWEFSVLRNSSKQTVAPMDKYPGCGIYRFDDCGPLEQ